MVMQGFRIAKVAAMGALALVAVTVDSASAQEEGVLMKDLLGWMGIVPEDRPAIDYRERAPLVVPPKMELRSPADPTSIQARAPNWPKDPDVEAARKRDAEARLPRTETDVYKRNQNPHLSIDQIRAGRRPGAGLQDGPAPHRNDGSRYSDWVHPDTLRGQGRSSEPTLAAGVEPERRQLSDPPTGLRKPVDGAKPSTTYDPIQREDPGTPQSFIRQQSRR